MGLKRIISWMIVIILIAFILYWVKSSVEGASGPLGRKFWKPLERISLQQLSSTDRVYSVGDTVIIRTIDTGILTCQSAPAPILSIYHRENGNLTKVPYEKPHDPSCLDGMYYTPPIPDAETTCHLPQPYRYDVKQYWTQTRYRNI